MKQRKRGSHLLTNAIEKKFYETLRSSSLKLLNAIPVLAKQLGVMTGLQFGKVIGYVPVTTPTEPTQACTALGASYQTVLTVVITHTSAVGARLYSSSSI